MTETKKHPGGRPSKYDPSFAKMLVDFFDIEFINFRDVTITYKDGSTKEISEEEASRLPFFRDFCKKIGITYATFKKWVKDESKPEFIAAYIEAKQLQANFIIENALRGNYHGFFAMKMMQNRHNWVDKREHKHDHNFSWTAIVREVSNNERAAVSV